MSLIRLLDISGHFFPVWRVKEAKNAPIGEAAAETVQALREMAAKSGADHVVACCDAKGKTFRHAIGDEWKATAPDYRGYKGNRAEKDPAMMAGLERVIDELEQDGVPILRAPGFEADDVIATVTMWAFAEGHEVEVYTEDKDLMALVGPGVRVVRRDGAAFGPEEVEAKFGVAPARLSEYLAIVGDSSDHVPGVKGMGDKAAQGLINKHGGYLAALDKAREEEKAVGDPNSMLVPDFTAKQRAALAAGEVAFRLSLRLTTLRTDVPLDFAQVTAPRVPKPKTNGTWEEQRARAARISTEIQQEETANMDITATPEQQPVSSPAPAAVVVEAPQSASPAPAQTHAPLAVIKPAAIRIARPFEMELEPRTYEEAMITADHAAESRLFKDIASPAAAMMLILLGRKFGLSAVDSLCMIHMIEGKPSMSAQLIVGIVQKSGMAEYFEMDECSNTMARWITKRRGARKEKAWTFTLDDAKKARLGGIYDKDKKTLRDDFDPNSNWAKHPAVMCSWRAAVFLARFVYTDLVGGLYMPDEIGTEEGEIDGNPMLVGVVENAA
jgi:5'-3' exonuclease